MENIDVVRCPADSLSHRLRKAPVDEHSIDRKSPPKERAGPSHVCNASGRFATNLPTKADSARPTKLVTSPPLLN